MNMSLGSRMLHAFLAVVFCVGLMPTLAYTNTAYADETSSEQPSIEELESDHSYATSEDATWVYTWEDAATYGMAITFDEQTKVESGYDYIYIYIGDYANDPDNATLYATYTGTTLAGATIYVPQTGTVSIRLTSDSSVCYWGFKVTSIEAMTSNDLELCGSIETITPAKLIDGVATPDVTVTYGANTLVEGTDYELVVTDNDECGEYVGTVTVTGIGDYEGTLTSTFSIYDDDNLLTYASITSGQYKSLRMSSDTGTVSISLSGSDAAYVASVTSVSVAKWTVDDNLDGITDDDGNYIYGEATVLDSSQYTVGTSTIVFNRTEDAPIFYVLEDEGDIYTYTRSSRTLIYNQTAYYEITIEAEGYETATAEVWFYTGTNSTFSIIIDTDGDDSTTDDQYVAYSWTSDEIAEMATFQNGSSQCGMTGFRTFSGYGVTLTDLLEIAGLEASADDSYEIHTSDDYGNTFTYESLFGTTRYFMQSIYDDEEVQDYITAYNDDASSGSELGLRILLAAKALEDESTVEPMISTGYVESYIYSSELADAVLPTADNTVINSLVGYENQFRFIYGIALEQEECTVTFDTGDGSTVESQVVLSHEMTSEENTTYKSSYWVDALIIYQGAGDGDSGDDSSDAAETITVPDDPTLDGYTFAGWYEDEECTVEFDFTANDGTVDEDTTIYAKWILEGYEDLESSHNYDNSVDECYVYTNEDSEYGFAITFDEDTYTESGYDYIYIYAGDYENDPDNAVLVGTYDGSDLADATVYVIGTDTFTIRLTSDSSYTYYGFKVSDLQLLTANDLELVGAVDAIQSQLYTGEALEPATTVTYGLGDQTITLVEGTDYTVEYADNTEVGTATVTITGIGDYTGTLTTDFEIVESRTAPLTLGDATWSGGDTVSFSISTDDADELAYYVAAGLEAVTLTIDGVTTTYTIADLDEDTADLVSLTSSSLTIPAAWLGLDGTTTEEVPSIDLTVVLTVAGYNDSSDDVNASGSWSDSLTVNYYDANGNLISSTYFDYDELSAMFTDEYATQYCDSAGLRLYATTGVTISDLLEAAGIDADPYTLGYVMQTASQAGTSSGTKYLGSYLFADRYYYRVFTDNETIYDDLTIDGVATTVATYLALGAVDESYTGSSTIVDGFITRCQFIRELAYASISWTDSEYAAIATEPILAYYTTVTSCTQSGHYITAGDNPNVMLEPDFDDATVGTGFQVLYGMGVEEEDGIWMAENSTTRNYSASNVAVVNVYDPNYVELTDEDTGVSVTIDATGSSMDRAYTGSSANSRTYSSEATVSEGWTLTIGTEASEALAAAISEAGGAASAVYSISLSAYGVDEDGLTDTSTTIEVTSDFGTATVTIPVEGVNDGSSVVVYIEDVDGNITTETVEVSDGAITLELTTTATIAVVDSGIVTRIAGSGRYATAALEALEAYDSADTVILATGENYADALSASSLAGALDAPVLLTKTAALSDEAAAAIEALGATNVIVVGGTGAVSADVVSTLESSGLTVTRLAGTNRYKTAEEIYYYGLSNGLWGDQIIIASGTGYADALSVSPLAYAEAYPILLANKDGELTDASTAIIRSASASGAADSAIITGGTGVVSESTEATLQGYFGDDAVTRLAGSTRYDTSAAIAEYAVANGYLTYENAAVATGTNYPDALAGSALQGNDGSVLLLAADGKTSALSVLTAAADDVSSVRILGGTGAVSTTVQEALASALGWDSYLYILVDGEE